MMQDIALTSPSAPSRSEVHRMFDRISRRYDLLNRILSLGLDRRWRRQAVAQISPGHEQIVLDLACGTCDIAIEAATRRRCRVIALDMAEEMLALGTAKVAAAGLDANVSLGRADGHNLPLPDAAVDAAIIAFGIRNMADVELCLRELARVARPGGKLVVLEFSLPSNRLMRFFHLAYIRYVVPVLGRLLSGDASAYTYLNKTIETFPYGEAFCRLMATAGWRDVSVKPLNGGIVSLYTGIRS
jgi:demethylmenaquinone methyltransferase/2-methoxy-6-polyprenyl-1,4-benzoquinol methylase